jgi:hypothetical protein
MSLSEVGHPQLRPRQQPDETHGKALHHGQVFEHACRDDAGDGGAQCQSGYEVPYKSWEAKIMSDGAERVSRQEKNSEEKK